MSLLKNLHPRFRVERFDPAAGEADIAKLAGAFPSEIPAEYLELVREGTEVELRVDGTRYLRIWGPKGVLDQSAGYPFRRYIPSAIPVGDDGGGNALVYMNGVRGPGLYWVDYGNIDADDARFAAVSMRGLLVEGG